jgi:predicted metalloendopeptidase
MLEALDDTVDPCDDFFEFACGAWNKKNIIPDDRASYNTFGRLKDELDVILKRKYHQLTLISSFGAVLLPEQNSFMQISAYNSFVFSHLKCSTLCCKVKCLNG